MPNAGKSTLISAVSAARPKVADYPFTTLVPNLGVVAVDVHSSFVMADIPGLISGAAAGAGLGVQFLRHLSRTRTLLHLVDAAPVDGSDPLANAHLIHRELGNYSPALARRTIWLVLSKSDLLDADACAALLAQFRREFPHRPVFAISAVTGDGVPALINALAAEVSATRERLAEDPEFAEAEAQLERAIAEDVLAKAQQRQPGRSPGVQGSEVEVVYVRGDE